MSSTLSPSAADLTQRWQAFREQHPKVRIRDAAAELGVSEAQLVATGCGGSTVRLRAPITDLLQQFEALGRVTALTRNESAVHEKRGTYRNIEVSPAHALVLDPEIDLRLFPRTWCHAFAVSQPTRDGVRPSFQIFDAAGDAVHKVFANEHSDAAAFERLTAEFKADDQSPELAVESRAAATPEKPDAEIDVEGFRAAWLALQDTHDFFPLLGRFGVSRTQALRLAPAGLAVRVETRGFRALLERVATDGLPIMVFVGNRGAIQIHTGPVQRVQEVAPWFNVLDPDFNLHVREDHIVDAWLVKKPTVDGVVTALELYDAGGSQIVQLFGKRKPGIPELEAWRETVAQVLVPLAS